MSYGLRVVLLLALISAQAARAGQAPVDDVFDTLDAASEKAQVRLITDNREAWLARWHVVEHCARTLDATYFIVTPDVFGRSLLGLMLRRAQAGVRIRLMVDARGSGDLARRFGEQELLQALVATGNVTIKVYNPWRHSVPAALRHLRAIESSNHDKLLIADGEWLVTGGRNIAREYFAPHEDDAHSWRDTDVLIRGGRACLQARQAFEEEWDLLANYTVTPSPFAQSELDTACRVMSNQLLGLGPQTAGELSPEPLKRDLQTQLLPLKHLVGYDYYEPFHGDLSYPVTVLDKHALVGRGRNDITPNLVRLIDATRTELVIQNPYVVVTPEARAALLRAGQRGVKIILLTNSPESTDSVATQAMFVRDWKGLLADIPTLRIFAVNQQRQLHAKVFVFDRRVAAVGTYNMDPMSQSINSEDIAVTKSPDFAARNALRIYQDLPDALEYTIRQGAAGPEQVTGPSDLTTKGTIRLLELLGHLSFLRPLI